MIYRLLEKNIQKRINSGKAIVLLGAHQTGKTEYASKFGTKNQAAL